MPDALTLYLTLSPRTGQLVGAGVRVQAQPQDSAGNVASITGVLFTVVKPDRSQFQFSGGSLGTAAIGPYLDLVQDQAGAWRVRVECTGPRAAAVERGWTVAGSDVVAPANPGPVWETRDLWALVSQQGLPLTAVRVPALPALPGGAAGADVLLPAAYQDVTYRVPLSALAALAAPLVTPASIGAAAAGDLAAEATARAAADTANAAAIGAEATTRAAADTAEATARSTGDATNAAAIAAEATARAAADTAEATARSAGDGTNAAAIAAEAATARAAEATKAPATLASVALALPGSVTAAAHANATAVLSGSGALSIAANTFPAGTGCLVRNSTAAAVSISASGFVTVSIGRPGDGATQIVAGGLAVLVATSDGAGGTVLDVQGGVG